MAYITSSSPVGQANPPEKLLTLQQAADVLGLHLWALRRAAKRGLIPTYSPFNSRRFVLLSEVLAFIEASRTGGL
ncbi:helix-turn-helix domain-containing protein [Ancylobacter sp. TS-1]|uniref:helix-turn-helix domain-containing protein n=1 Tax=Ancylobacter sp. TS-1 TaxID=1850374 RepID=UPI001265BA39|nr:helix-turn-helix domain-containing protein [Ancylobacter sp. TS-1]QFR33832.1 helix-turn-helix domain-containing protein [Ancylobacter sp. TS-1]